MKHNVWTTSCDFDEEELLSNLYDFVLDESITERERRIRLLAKADLEASAIQSPF